MILGDGRNENSSARDEVLITKKSSFKKDTLYPRVTAAVHAILQYGTVVAPVDVMMRIGFLEKDRFEDWRFGRVPYLERVITCNLSKAQRVLKLLRYHAEERGLKPSVTVSKKWGKGRKTLLRYSKSGSPYMESLYATHYAAGQPKRRVSNEEAPEGSEGGVETR
jgi:hypothetical protein